MRIAICYNGIVGKRNGDKHSIRQLEQNYKRHTSHDVDVFCHSWHAGDIGCRIDNILKPILSIHENQIQFSLPALEVKQGWEPRATKSHFIDGRYQFNQKSSAFSVKKVIELKKHYETLHKFNYDMVILTRYDIKISPFINTLSEIDKYVYFERPKNDHDGRIKDYIFVSNSDNMDRYGELYDKLDVYRYERENYKKIRTSQCLSMDPHIFKKRHIETFAKPKAIIDSIHNFETFILR